MNSKNSSDFTILTINSKAKWKAERISADGLCITEDGLTLRSSFEYAFDRVIGKPEGVKKPTDLAVDRCGILFILDGKESRIATYDPRQERLEWIDCIGGIGDLPTEFNSPEAIAVTDRTLYVADTGNHRVIAFARVNWQVRWIVEGEETPGSPPEEIFSPPGLGRPMEPCDLAVDADENLYVLDWANLLIRKFDPGGCLVRVIRKDPPFHPVNIAIDNSSRGDIGCLLLHICAGKSRERCADKIHDLLEITYNKMSADDKTRFVEALMPLATGPVEEQLEVVRSQLGQGIPATVDMVGDQLAPLIENYQSLLYVLDAESQCVSKFTADGESLDTVVDLNVSGLGNLHPSGLALDQEGNIYVASAEEENGFIYKFDAGGDFIPPPITAYRGRTDELTVDQEFNLYILNGKREEITKLSRKKKFAERGVYFSADFDSTIDDCNWHKLLINTTRPEKTQVRISYCIENKDEPPTPQSAASPPASDWLKPLVNPTDALILGPRGRYLRLKIELSGDGQSTPIVHSVQVYFERISYLRYLPAVYQADEASRDFLERFLSLFETLFYNLEGKINGIAGFFDPLAADKDFLPWLGQWLATAFDENWPPDKQRQFLRRAAMLYKARGTRRGLEEIIELYTGEGPVIFESFQLDCIKNAQLREDYERIFGKDPFHFCVLLKPGQIQTEGEYFAVKRIVDSEKPAHTDAGVLRLQPWFYLGLPTYLGINTCLQKPEMRLEQNSVISRDSVLTDVEETGQVERRSRMDIDTALT